MQQLLITLANTAHKSHQVRTEPVGNLKKTDIPCFRWVRPMKQSLRRVAAQQANKPRYIATLCHRCHFNCISISDAHRLGAWHKMAAIAAQVSVAVLLLFASSYWTSAHKNFDEEEVYVSDEGEEEAPTYYLGKAAFAPTSTCSDLSQLCCTCFYALHSVTDLITYRRKIVYNACVSCTKPSCSLVHAPSPCKLFTNVLCMLPCLWSAQTMAKLCS